MIENAGAGRDSQESSKKANGIHVVAAGHLLAIHQGKLVMSAIGKAWQCVERPTCRRFPPVCCCHAEE